MTLLKTVWALALALLAAAAPAAEPASYLVTGARVADGTGKPLAAQDVRVSGDRIAEVGHLKARPGERVVKGDGLVLAPGFIDVHNHSTKGLVEDPLAETQISQGITTLVLGPDGDSPWPIADYLKARREAPATVNVMTMVGHETVRSLVLQRGLQARGDTRGGREDGRARRAGDAGRRPGRFLRARVRRRELVVDRRAGRALQGDRALRRLLHDARPGRGRQGHGCLCRGRRDLEAIGSAAADLAHQAGDRRRLGQGEGGRGLDRRGPGRRPGRDRGLLSLRGMALGPLHARAEQEILRPGQRRAGPQGRRWALPDHRDGVRGAPLLRRAQPRGDRARRGHHARRALLENHPRRRRGGHRPHDDRRRRRVLLPPALGHGRQRRRHRQRPPPRRRDVPARARPLRSRETPVLPRGGHPQDDLAPRKAGRPDRPRHDRSRHEGRSGPVRSGNRDRPLELRKAPRARPGHRVGRRQRRCRSGTTARRRAPNPAASSPAAPAEAPHGDENPRKSVSRSCSP